MGDDWALSDYAFDLAPTETATLAESIASFFAPTGGGNFLAASDATLFLPFGPRGVNGAELAAAMASFGHGWTNDAQASITLSNLSQYDAVFLAGKVGSEPEELLALRQYVLAGGGVFLMGGTGDHGDDDDEANAWAPLLSEFGLALSATSFGGMAGAISSIPTSPDNTPPAQGVSSIAWSEGQLPVVLNPGNPRVRVALRGDFAAAGGGPQGTMNDVLVVYEAPFLAGDFNDDGVVDAADYAVWRRALGSGATLPGDATPGVVAGDDYLAWRENFGAQASGSVVAANTAAPEPRGMMLALLCCGALLFFRGSRVLGAPAAA